MRDKASDAVSHRAIARDITARKRAETGLISARERAEYASQAKSRFLATVSHEIRTPMNGIMGMAKLLADTRLSPEQRTYVGAVSTSASALLALIEDLLDYSKIEAGRFELEPQPMSLREIADNVVELLAARAYAKGIGLGCHVAPDVPPTITADPGRVRQVLLNLIGNAIKFTDSGGVLVEVANAGSEAAPAIRFSVTDTGPGIAPGDLERIFEEFEQADGTSTRAAWRRRPRPCHFAGGIVTSMGGTIGVSSELGVGSTFDFEVPASDARDVAESGAAMLAGRRVVILSKNVVEAEAIARTIRAMAARPKSSRRSPRRRCTPPAATRCWSTPRWSRPTGEVLKRLRQAGFERAQAITLIAPTDRGMLGEFRASGYATFLARPVRGETLLRTLLNERMQPASAGASTVVGENRPPARPCSSRPVDPDRRGQRHQRHAGARHAAQGRASRRRRRQRQGGGRRRHRLAGKMRYDVVLMDLHMPVMDGLDAIAADPPPRGGSRRRARADHGAVGRQPGKDPPRRCLRTAPAASSPSRSTPTRSFAPSRNRRPPELSVIAVAGRLSPARPTRLLPAGPVHGTVTILLHCPLIPAPRGMARRRITRAISTDGARNSSSRQRHAIAEPQERRNPDRRSPGQDRTAGSAHGPRCIRDRRRPGGPLPRVL